MENDENENQPEIMDRQNIASLVSDQVDRTNDNRSAQDCLYTRFEIDYVVEQNCDDAQFHHSYRFIRDFEIKDFKVNQNMTKNMICKKLPLVLQKGLLLIDFVFHLQPW